MKIKILRSVLLTGFVFGLLGFMYIAGNAWLHPETLPLPLTHFLSFPREDTFGAICFATSMMCFFVYNIVNQGKK